MELEIVTVGVKYLNFVGDACFGELEVNKLIQKDTVGVFEDLFKLNFNIESVCKANGRLDREIIILNQTTAWNKRKVLGSDKWSKHAFGFAIDLNPRVNPAIPSLQSEIYDFTGKGPGIITSQIVECWKDWGFLWGGEIFPNFWDSHHFEHKIGNEIIYDLGE